ncbi:MAG: hypothetical protein ACRC31_02990, partial [Cetobacterium sp.]
MENLEKNIITVLTKSTKKKSGFKYLTRSEVALALNKNPEEIKSLLESLKNQGYIFFSKNEESNKGLIYLKNNYIIKKTNNIEMKFIKILSPLIIIPIVAIVISTYFTYESLIEIENIYIKILMAFTISSISSLSLYTTFIHLQERNLHMGILFIFFSILTLSLNITYTAKYLYQNYETNRIKIVDPKIESYKNLETEKELLLQAIKNNEQTIGNYLERKTAGSDYRVITLSEQNKEYIQQINEINYKIDNLQLENKKEKMSIFESLENILNISETLIFFIYSILPSIVLDLIAPLILAFYS